MSKKLSIFLKNTGAHVNTVCLQLSYHLFANIILFGNKTPLLCKYFHFRARFFLHKCHSCHLWQIPCLIGYLTKWLHPLILTFHISSILQRRYARDIWNCNFNIEEFFILVWLKSNWIMSLPSTPVFQVFFCEQFDKTLYSV